MHFETDPDTVDGCATYHAPIIEAGEAVDATLAALLQPVLELRLLPYLRAQYACPDLVVADALAMLPSSPATHCRAATQLNSTQLNSTQLNSPARSHARTHALA